jgi:octaprenyl-diphosphate synthase
MHRFGELLGMAFQIKDDLFDYGERKIGKPIGIDIKEKKMTLPLIYTLNTVSPKEKRAIINTVKNHNKDKKKVNDLIALVKAKGGLDFAIQKMEEYKSQAKQLLSDFPKNEYRDALELMLNYVTERKI